MAHQREIDLRAEQNENEQPHDERRGQHIFLELLRFAGLHLEPERLLVSEHDAEHENRHEAAGLQTVGREIGADHGDQRYHRRIFGEEGPFLMADEKRRQISQHNPGDDADHGLLQQIEQ